MNDEIELEAVVVAEEEEGVVHQRERLGST